MNTEGGTAAARIAAARLRVASTRLSRIRFFCAALHRLPAIDSPARFTIAWAPSTSAVHAPASPFGFHVTTRASGTLDTHYAPHTPARIVAAESLAHESLRIGSSFAVLARTVARPPTFAGTWIQAPAGAVAYAHDLYASLRALDHAGAKAILVENVPDDAAWLAVRDRLRRATT